MKKLTLTLLIAFGSLLALAPASNAGVHVGVFVGPGPGYYAPYPAYYGPYYGYYGYYPRHYYGRHYYGHYGYYGRHWH